MYLQSIYSAVCTRELVMYKFTIKITCRSYINANRTFVTLIYRTLATLADKKNRPFTIYYESYKINAFPSHYSNNTRSIYNIDITRALSLASECNVLKLIRTVS